MPKLDASYINRDFLEEISGKKPGRWICDATFDWAVIAATITIACALDNFYAYVGALFLIGNRQHALALLGHDGTHFTIHKSKKLNDFISDMLAFFPLGLTTSGYRSVHFLHHKHLNTVDDPELMHRASKAPQWDLPITMKKVSLLAFLDLFGYSASDYWLIVKSAKPAKNITRYQMLACHVIFIGISLAFSMPQLPLIWYASLLTTFMMFFRLRTWLEHQGSEETHRLKLNRLEEAVFSPHRSWYHYEHHNFPSVPYACLHHIREKMQGTPVITLRDLLKFYASSRVIMSGAATRKMTMTKDKKDVTHTSSGALAA